MGNGGLRVVGVALTVLVIVSACGGTGADRKGPALSAEQRTVRHDYLAYWDAMLHANAVSDPDAAELATRAAGRQLSLVRENLAHAREQGIIAKGTVGHQIRQVSVVERLGYVVDCVDVNQWLQYEVASGVLKKDQLLQRPKQLAKFVLAPRDGAWLVTDTEELGGC